MRKMITIGLLSFNAISFAGNFFNVTGTSSSMNIALNIPTNMTYKSVGIKMSGGYTLTNPGSECAMNNKGYCIFELSQNTSKTFSITGSGDQVGATICLNGNGPLSCQTASYSTLGSVTYTDYVYVVEPSSVKLCLADDQGNLSACQDSGATGLVNAQSIVFDSNAQYAYISTQGNGPSATGAITSCSVNPTNKFLSACQSTTLGVLTNLPQQLAYLNTGGAEYIYMAAGTTVYRCTVNAGTVSSCSEPSNNLAVSNNITGIGINPGLPTTYAYVVENDINQLENCNIDTSSNSLTCNSTVSTLSNPEFISINSAQTGVYLPFYNGVVRFYPIVNDEVVTIGSVQAGSSFNQPKQSTPNSTGTFAFVSNSLNSTVSVCSISLNNTFLSCQVSSENFSGPTGITVLPY